MDDDPLIERYASNQADLLRDVMLSAAECRTWYSMRQLVTLTGISPNGISARWAALRQTGHIIQRRWGKFGMHEYQISQSDNKTKP